MLWQLLGSWDVGDVVDFERFGGICWGRVTSHCARGRVNWYRRRWTTNAYLERGLLWLSLELDVERPPSKDDVVGIGKVHLPILT